MQRTHVSGLLGYGVYFGNEFEVSHQYTSSNNDPNNDPNNNSSRFILVADVALGNVYECTHHDTTLFKPPEGYLFLLFKKRYEVWYYLLFLFFGVVFIFIIFFFVICFVCFFVIVF